ncbi:hypothetical protein [Promicromonospora sp. NPDC057488]|uniref:hypothetical protein n=1 Tax=Promicromonospora sp. NPDC057488 TaxID=3346147 RepID=UPI0036716110
MGAGLRPELPENGLRAFLTTATTGSYAETDRTHGWTATTAYRRCGELEGVLAQHLNLSSAVILRQNQETRRLETTPLGDALIPLAQAYLRSNDTFWDVLEAFASATQESRRQDGRRRSAQPRQTGSAPRVRSL